MNESELELRDAILIESGGDGRAGENAAWARSGPGPSVAIERQRPASRRRNGWISGPGPDPNPFLEALRATWESRAENHGEIRLVAWVPAPIRGQVIEPPIDRRRGFTAVLVHLRIGSPPSPGRPAIQPVGRRAERPTSARVDQKIERRRSRPRAPAGRAWAGLGIRRDRRRPGRPVMTDIEND